MTGETTSSQAATDAGSSQRRMIVIGIVGIGGLLAFSLFYALLDSSLHYEPDQINQFALEQSIEIER